MSKPIRYVAPDGFTAEFDDVKFLSGEWWLFAIAKAVLCVAPRYFDTRSFEANARDFRFARENGQVVVREITTHASGGTA